ncbi:hypothetical protein LWI28_027389 [Acer negundo]|uniref:Mediator of RNA polymerase II transcription subunit 6 n=1 Tax=Acer negundo TaxID=4023 RepID=A0AAD5IHF9_ACENE|nr:hypothetical protein LWI28_027389 [Acer negundo]
MTGIEYMPGEVMEPHLFVIRKQKRDSLEKVTPMLSYYLLDGSIYQAPPLCNIFAAIIGQALYYIQKAFTTAALELEKIGYAPPPPPFLEGYTPTTTGELTPALKPNKQESGNLLLSTPSSIKENGYAISLLYLLRSAGTNSYYFSSGPCHCIIQAQQGFLQHLFHTTKYSKITSPVLKRIFAYQLQTSSKFFFESS